MTYALHVCVCLFALRLRHFDLLALLSVGDGKLGQVAKVSWSKVFTVALSLWKLEAEPL